MPKFGVSIYSISREIMKKAITPEEGVRWLAEKGAEVIELVPFGIDFINEPDLINRMIQASKDCGVPLTNYSLNANFLFDTKEEYETEINRIKAHINAVQKLSIPSIRIDCSSYRRDITKNNIEIFQKELPLIVETYEMLCDYAKTFGMSILIENHGHLANGSERVRQILLGVKRDNFGHQLDTGNYVCVDDKAEITVRKMLPFAKTIHMKDFYLRNYDRDPGDTTQFDCSGSWFKSLNGTYLRGSILAQGDLDMYDIIKSIKKSNFDGNIYIEFEGIEDCYYGTKVSLDNLKRIYEAS